MQEQWPPSVYGLAMQFSTTPRLAQRSLRHDGSGVASKVFWLSLPGISGIVNVGRKGICGRSAAGTI